MSDATDEMLTIRPQRVRIIGMTSGCVTLKKPFSETSMTRCHCSARMPGKTASSWTPALLTTIWTGPPSSRRSQALRAASRVGDVEGDRFGAAAGADDPRDDGVRAGAVGVRVGDHVRAVAAEPLGDRLADAAARAGDEGALADGSGGDVIARCARPASRTTATRPEASSRPSWRTTNA